MADYKKEPKDYTSNPDTRETRGFTQKPGAMDYVKEAFLPSIQRAQLEAVRKAREKAGS